MLAHADGKLNLKRLAPPRFIPCWCLSQKGMVFKMKVAVASDGINITEHFGCCKGFLVFSMVNFNILTKEFIANPGHRPGVLPIFLNDLGVRVIISGGMGGGAIEIFDEKGI
jgi:predicted Fe-Mo cluster-binding NifX family protein